MKVWLNVVLNRQLHGIVVFLSLWLGLGSKIHHHPSQQVLVPVSPVVTMIRGGGSAHLRSSSNNNNNNSTKKEEEDDSNLLVGGGAINEKRRSVLQQTVFADPKARQDGHHPQEGISSRYNPTKIKSHLGHALEGMDRYPNYLSRWSLEDTESLERALEVQLENVRAQKLQVMERRRSMHQLVSKLAAQDKRWESFLEPPRTWQEIQSTILDPRAAHAIFQSKQFRRGKHNNKMPSVQDVLSGKTTVELDAGYLQELMDEEISDVYTFPLLSKEFCKRLEEYVRAVMSLTDTAEFEHLQIKDLDTVGMGWINDLVFHLVMRPISRHIYKETEAKGDLDWRQGYIAAYSASPSKAKPRQRLVSHTDDSEVTLNICIGDVFEGGLLAFRGLRGDSDAGALGGDYQPQIGRALLHAGRHLHEVTRVTSGERFAYIMWARSWSGTRSQTCACCWLNRREGNSCICGPRWN
jgi:hypothetical protein